MAEQDDAFFAAAQFETQAVHVGSAPDPATGSVIPPIYQTSTFAQEEVGRHKGYEYARTGNPTRASLEVCLAATTTVLQTLGPGDHLILSSDVYGGTYRVVARLFAEWGLGYDLVDLTDLDALKQA